ncbi:MAG: hypothetical protein IJ638_01495 [Alphaproteobacteria bacterium]|nr:hypothetical protein [Alphaproteobacteria bacterium]
MKYVNLTEKEINNIWEKVLKKHKKLSKKGRQLIDVDLVKKVNDMLIKKQK